MKTLLKDLLNEECIEYFGIIPFGECRVIHQELLERSCSGWQPRSAVMLLVPYYSGEYEGRNISRYAVACDYHRFFRNLYARLEQELSSAFPQYRFRGFADHSPIGEIGAAAKAGLGRIGDKGQLIHEVYGSYTFVGEILTDMVPERYDTVPIATCEHCGACERACPSKDGCLSEITQRKGDLSDSEIALMRTYRTAWGCDLCRASCPHNQGIPLSPIPFFRSDLTPVLTTELVSGMSKAAFEERAYSWRGRKTILRNLQYLEEN